MMNNIETVSVSNFSDHEKEITVTLPKESVQEEYKKALNKIQNTASYPGFRKGKMPPSMVENLFSHQIKKICIENLIDKTLGLALKKEEQTPISQPVIKELDDLLLGNSYTYKASFEVRPPINIEKYEGFELSIKQQIFEDSLVEKELLEIREMFANFIEPKDRDFIQENDLVFAESEVKIDGVLNKKYSEKENRIPLFASDVPENIKSALLNKKINEQVIIPHTLPENHEVESLRGKTCELCFKITSIKEKVLPELDDELAKDFSNGDLNLSELTQKIIDRIKNSIKRRNDYYLKDAITKALVENNPLNPPKALVERVAISFIKDELKRYDKKTQDKIIKNSWARLWQMSEPRAIFQVKSELIWEELIKKLDIKENEERVDDILKNFKDISKEDAIYSSKVEELINTIKDRSKITYVTEKKE